MKDRKIPYLVFSYVQLADHSPDPEAVARGRFRNTNYCTVVSKRGLNKLAPDAE